MFTVCYHERFLGRGSQLNDHSRPKVILRIKVAETQGLNNEFQNLTILKEVAESACAWQASKVLTSCTNDLKTFASILMEHGYELPHEQRVLFTQKVALDLLSTGQIDKLVVVLAPLQHLESADVDSWDIDAPTFGDIIAPEDTL